MAASTDSKCHRGIFREENIALREILGYSLDTILTSPYMPPNIGDYIPGTLIKDVLFVAIDVDKGRSYGVTDISERFHVGISIFDTRCLTPHDSEENGLSTEPWNTINSYQYTNKSSRLCNYAAKRFLFGETECLDTLHLLPNRFSALIKNRVYILVAHGIYEDVKFLNGLDTSIVSRASYVLDTVKVAQFPLQLNYRYNLEKLLHELGLPYAKLHTAGNDAHFALKALLLLAVRDGRQTSSSASRTESGEERLFCRIEDIVHLPCGIPLPKTSAETSPPPRKEKIGINAK